MPQQTVHTSSKYTQVKKKKKKACAIFSSKYNCEQCDCMQDHKELKRKKVMQVLKRQNNEEKLFFFVLFFDAPFENRLALLKSLAASCQELRGAAVKLSAR